MYESLKSYLNVPVTWLHQGVPNGWGDTTTDSSNVIKVYPVEQSKVIVNHLGIEVVSSTTFYVDPITIGTYTYDDKITFQGEDRSILKIETYYDTAGAPSIMVVYV